jgi:hypothetical protein
VANGLDMFHDMFDASGGKCEGPGRGSVKFGVNPIETYREIHHAESLTPRLRYVFSMFHDMFRDMFLHISLDLAHIPNCFTICLVFRDSMIVSS